MQDASAESGRSRDLPGRLRPTQCDDDLTSSGRCSACRTCIRMDLSPLIWGVPIARVGSEGFPDMAASRPIWQLKPPPGTQPTLPTFVPYTGPPPDKLKPAKRGKVAPADEVRETRERHAEDDSRSRTPPVLPSQSQASDFVVPG